MSRPEHQQWVIDNYRRKPRTIKGWLVVAGFNAVEISITVGLTYRALDYEIPAALDNILGFATGAYIWLIFLLAWLMTFIAWMAMHTAGEFKKAATGTNARAIRHTKYKELVKLFDAFVGSGRFVERLWGWVMGIIPNICFAVVMVALGWWLYPTMYLLAWGFGYFWGMCAKNTMIEAIETIPYDELLYLEDRPVAWGARNEAEAEQIRAQRGTRTPARDRVTRSEREEPEEPAERDERPIPGPPEPDETPQPRPRGIREIIFREDQ